jgi:tRNA A37 threonylcarbamoyladenosine dehydratase
MELIKEELESQKERFENYTDKLETAADVRAAAALGKQTDEYNAIKTKRDELKATYDALVKHDDEGTFTDNNLFPTYEKGLDALYAAEEEYYHQEDIYTSAKAALELRTEEANEKAYAKSKAEEVRATADLAAATAGATAAQAAVATIAEAVTAAEAEVERILKIFNSGASN